MNQHWLVRDKTIRLLWVLFVIILALVVVAGLFIGDHAFFGIDGSFAFNAWYGIASCVGMIVIAKLLGRLLHRKDGYYDRD